jgi:hypothetical protein
MVLEPVESLSTTTRVIFGVGFRLGIFRLVTPPPSTLAETVPLEHSSPLLAVGQIAAALPLRVATPRKSPSARRASLALLDPTHPGVRVWLLPTKHLCFECDP